MPRDVPLVSDKDRTVAFRLKVLAVADESAFARFDLAANQAAPLNVFVRLEWLAEKIEQPGRANMLLAARPKGGGTAAELNTAIGRSGSRPMPGWNWRDWSSRTCLNFAAGESLSKSRSRAKP